MHCCITLKSRTLSVYGPQMCTGPAILQLFVFPLELACKTLQLVSHSQEIRLPVLLPEIACKKLQLAYHFPTRFRIHQQKTEGQWGLRRVLLLHQSKVFSD